ncbi:MAG: hypothetical protein ACFB0E_19415 [Leptolyngbyaceae cyanobacterium]
MTYSPSNSRPHNQNLTSYYHSGNPHQAPSSPMPTADFAPPRRAVPSHSHQVPHSPTQRQYPSTARQPMGGVAMPPYTRQKTATSPRRAVRFVRRRAVRRRSLLWSWLTRGGVVAGGSVLALTTLTAGPKPFADQAATSTSEKAVCQEVVQDKSVLSRSELSELLAVAERAPKADVRAVIAEPYCTLSNVEVREGVTARREAYPLEFNPETWFIVLYEGEEYAGFDFSFSR